MHRSTLLLVIVTAAILLVSPVAAHEGHQHPEDEQQTRMDDCLDNEHCHTAPP